MDSLFPVIREDLYHLQMDVKHVQVVQSDHAERLLRLERRQASDAALKSVWSSPFPSMLNGTPQQGPIATPTADVFDDFDGQGQSLLTSLHLESDEEPSRRGASRANSVRFDVSAIQGSNWAQNSRITGDFGPTRPNSAFGSHPMTERSLSHKSDGRHSSAGHSVHSMHSGRTNSLGLDTNFIIGGRGDDSPVSIPEPPPGLFVLGSVPSIIRCWLNTNFSHNALLYAVVCTGSQKSLLEYSLVKDLGMLDQLLKSPLGSYSIRLPVYLPEAIVTQPTSRSNSPAPPSLPTLTANFEVTGINQRSSSERRNGLRIFIGSDTLRAHSADLLFSQNIMTIYGDDRNKLSIPFVRPEDDSIFKDLCTTNVFPEKVELKATAPAFTPSESRSKASFRGELSIPPSSNGNGACVELKSAVSTFSSPNESRAALETESGHSQAASSSEAKSRASSFEDAQSHRTDEHATEEASHEDGTAVPNASSETSTASDGKRRDSSRRDSSGGIWSSWRKENGPTMPSGNDAPREFIATSGYQRPSRGGRSMKVLKPSKPPNNSTRSTSGARTGSSYEPVPRASGETRRKSQVATTNSNGQALNWEAKRTLSGDIKVPKDLSARPLPTVPRSSNPIGGASAFAWMNSGKGNKSSTATTAAE